MVKFNDRCWSWSAKKHGKQDKFVKKYLIWILTCSSGLRCASFVTSPTLNFNISMKESLGLKLLPILESLNLSLYFRRTLLLSNCSRKTANWLVMRVAGFFRESEQTKCRVTYPNRSVLSSNKKKLLENWFGCTWHRFVQTELDSSIIKIQRE